MPPAAQRTVYVRRADAKSGSLESGSEVDDIGRGGGKQEVEETATGSGAGVFGRTGGKGAATHTTTDTTTTSGEAMIPKHNARNWGRERNSKVVSIEAGAATVDSSHNLEGELNDRVTKASSMRTTSPSASKHVKRHWALERVAKYRAKALKWEEPAISIIGVYTLVGPAALETLDPEVVRRGVVSMLSSIDVPTAVGFTTLTAGALESSTPTAHAPATTAEYHHTTIKGPPTRFSATPSASHGERRVEYRLPRSYVVSWYAILAVLVSLWSIALLFYFVNFPPKFLMQKKATRKHGKRRYTEVLQDTRNDQCQNQEIGSAAFTTSSDTPCLTSPCLRSRRQVSGGHTESGAVGLGIELDEFSHKRQMEPRDKALPEPPRSASMPRSAPLPAYSRSDNVPVLRHARTQDPENGLTTTSHKYDNTYLSPHRISPYSSSDSESGSGRSSRSASPHRVLKKVGNGIEYLAAKAARIMHDQVKSDPEEHLLLPVRDCERERAGEGFEKLY